jgi:lysophospholipase L1-like esterase
MGDSITHRWDLSQLDNGPTVNLGVEGDTTAQMLARFNDVIASGAGVVVILGGTNDFYYNGIANSNTDNIAAMAAMAKAAGIRVILGSMLPAHYPDTYPAGTTPTLDQVRAWNDSLITLASKNGYLYADYFDEFLLPDGTEDFSLYSDYGVHPNAAGYTKMWAVVAPLIEEELQ